MKEKNNQPKKELLDKLSGKMDGDSQTPSPPEVDDTTREIIEAHDDRSEEGGVDEQYGGDAADNRDFGEDS